MHVVVAIVSVCVNMPYLGGSGENFFIYNVMHAMKKVK